MCILKNNPFFVLHAQVEPHTNRASLFFAVSAQVYRLLSLLNDHIYIALTSLHTRFPLYLNRITRVYYILAHMPLFDSVSSCFPVFTIYRNIAIAHTHNVLHKHTRCVRTHLHVDIKDRDIMTVATLLNIVDEKNFTLGQKMWARKYWCVYVYVYLVCDCSAYRYIYIVEVVERLFF